MVQTIPPIPEEFIRGDVKSWAQQAGIVLQVINARWWMKAGDGLEEVDKDNRWTALNFHGGGYMFGSAMNRKGGFSRIPSGFVDRDIFARVLSVDYTLTGSSPERLASFPLQLLEGLSAYYYMLHTLNVSPSRIIFVGDSAGAHLVLSLVRYILESQCLDPPAGIVLLSPWCDMRDPNHPSIRKFLGQLPPELMQSRYFSPALHAPLPGWPPTFISSADNERIASSIVGLEGRLSGAGVSVDWLQTEGIKENLSHDFLIRDVVAKVWPEKVQELWQRLGAWAAHLA
ncbi:alpha/beta-hydrolase [Sparassis latifolia]